MKSSSIFAKIPVTIESFKCWEPRPAISFRFFFFSPTTFLYFQSIFTFLLCRIWMHYTTILLRVSYWLTELYINMIYIFLFPLTSIYWIEWFIVYPGMKAPSFRCTDAPDGALILHYYSDRPGLESIVIGIVNVSLVNLRCAAKQLHSAKLTCSVC